MRPGAPRTVLLGLAAWVSMLSVSLLAWATLWHLVRRAVADLDPVRVAAYAAPAGAALAAAGILMAVRTASAGTFPIRRPARVRPQIPPRP